MPERSSDSVEADPTQGSSTNPETPGTDDRNDAFNVREPNHFTEQNLKAFHNFNPTTVRNWEAISSDYASYINTVNGYVSDAALVNQVQRRYIAVDRAGYERREIVQGMLCACKSFGV
jgi:hypothetical protein